MLLQVEFTTEPFRTERTRVTALLEVDVDHVTFETALEVMTLAYLALHFSLRRLGRFQFARVTSHVHD